MPTPTPGAASELLRDAMELLGAIGVGKAGEHALHNACNLRNRIDAYLQRTQIERPLGDSASPALARPLDVGHAPVMEGAQREAVALPERFERCRRVTDEISSAWDDGWNACLDEFAKLNPPPPDRVQPERGEAAECDYCDGTGKISMDELGDGPCPQCGYVEVRPAPPTDASGGVTDDELVWKVCDAVRASTDKECLRCPRTCTTQYGEGIQMCYAIAEEIIEWVRAADRARKPVDASAQAASAGEPVVQPSGYAYRYASSMYEGCTVIRFNHGEEVNGGKPIEVIPYYFGAAPTPVAAYREVTLDDVQKMLLTLFDAGDDVSVGQAMVDGIRSIGAVIRTTDAPTYRPCTFADAERIKASADGVPPLESETNDMLAALNKHGAVIGKASNDREPPHCPTCDCGPK